MELDRDNLMRSIGLRLKQLRKQLGYSRQKMASRLGISDSGYSKNEFGLTFPGNQTLHRLKRDYDISMDWLLFNQGPMYYKEKLQAGELEKLEKKVAELQKELEQARQQKMADKTPAQPELAPEVKELVEQMGRIPLLHYEILAYFHRFKMENKALTDVRQRSAKKAD